MTEMKKDKTIQYISKIMDSDSVITERQGIVLEQNKEPALSRDIRTFFSPKLEIKTIRGYEPSRENQDIITISKNAKITDEATGTALCDVLYFANKHKCTTVIVDAIDDEPYISSQLAPALKLSDELARGVELAKRAIGAEHAEIEIYKNLFDSQIKIGNNIEGIPVVRVGGGYPAESLARRAKPKNAVVIGACALIHLARAVDFGRVQTTCFVTVAGDCVSTPMNIEVTMDKTLEDVLNFCGLMFDPTRVVIGGSMKGSAVTDLAATCVTPMTRGVLAFKETFKDYHYTCIGCGRCAEVCPQGLVPYYIYKFVKSNKYQMLKKFDIDMCIDCGTCSYICPAKLNISTVIAEGKLGMEKYLSREAQNKVDRQEILRIKSERIRDENRELAATEEAEKPAKEIDEKNADILKNIDMVSDIKAHITEPADEAETTDTEQSHETKSQWNKSSTDPSREVNNNHSKKNSKKNTSKAVKPTKSDSEDMGEQQ